MHYNLRVSESELAEILGLQAERTAFAAEKEALLSRLTALTVQRDESEIAQASAPVSPQLITDIEFLKNECVRLKEYIVAEHQRAQSHSEQLELKMQAIVSECSQFRDRNNELVLECARLRDRNLKLEALLSSPPQAVPWMELQIMQTQVAHAMSQRRSC
jgi:hypothetical protein